jgi:transmembrane sensor
LEEQDIYLLITRYLANQTSTEESERLADWIAESGEHEQTFEEIKSLWQASTKNITTVTGPLNKLKSRIKEEEPTTAWSIAGRSAKWYAIAASAILFSAFSSLAIYQYINSPSNKVYSLAAAAGQKKLIKLEDGTAVYLAPQSTLKYPEHFGSSRTVELQGQAYFEVSKNTHRPFIVHTANLDVQVLGTHFNVNNYQNQGLTKVSLLEGKVKVSISDDGLDEYLLGPGQELALNHTNHQVYRYTLDSMAVKGWMTNTLVFNNEKLADVARKIEQMYGVKLVFADQATAETGLYAKFRNEPLNVVLETIAASGNIIYHIEGNKVYLNLKH